MNLEDNLRQNDASKTPLEFVYEAADCRMWFTAPMITDVTGSTGDSSSVSGGTQFRGGDGMVTLAGSSQGNRTGMGNSPSQFTGDASGRRMSLWTWLVTAGGFMVMLNW